MGNKIEINVGSYQYDDDNDCLGFIDGELYASVRSYCIDSFGTIDLSKQDTHRVYEVMKKYYEECEE